MLHVQRKKVKNDNNANAVVLLQSRLRHLVERLETADSFSLHKYFTSLQNEANIYANAKLNIL